MRRQKRSANQPVRCRCGAQVAQQAGLQGVSDGCACLPPFVPDDLKRVDVGPRLPLLFPACATRPLADKRSAPGWRWRAHLLEPAAQHFAQGVLLIYAWVKFIGDAGRRRRRLDLFLASWFMHQLRKVRSR